MLSLRSAARLNGLRSTGTSRACPKSIGSKVVIRIPEAPLIPKRWHTHIEDNLVKDQKTVDALKATIEARLAQAPSLAEFMTTSNPAASEFSSGMYRNQN